MKVAIINPPAPHEEESLKQGMAWINGVIYVESAVRAAGHETVIMDFQHGSPEYASDCHAALVSTNISSYDFLKNNLDNMKSVFGKIIVGGQLLGSYGQNIDNLLMREFPQIDIGVIGEGEHIIQTILDRLENDAGLDDIPGLVIRQDEMISLTAKKTAADLDDSIDFDYSKWSGLLDEARGNIMMTSTSRGCYNRCSFCHKPYKGIRYHDIGWVKKNIEDVRRLDVAGIALTDEIFLQDRTRALMIGGFIRDAGLPWYTESRVNDVELITLTELVKMGCAQMRLGIESADDTVLRINCKNQTLEQARNAVDICKRAGLQPFGYFIFGLPGETKRSIDKTIRFIEETEITSRARLFMPLPGTAVYNHYVRKGVIDELSLLKAYSENSDTLRGDFVPLNITEDVSDEELISARDYVMDIR